MRTYEQLIKYYEEIKNCLNENIKATEGITEIINKKFDLLQEALTNNNLKSANEISITILILLDGIKETYKLNVENI